MAEMTPPKAKRFAIERFSEDLRMTRASRRVTCRSLEAQSGISNAFINQIENHQQMPHVDRLLWLCDWMGKSFDSYVEEL